MLKVADISVAPEFAWQFLEGVILCPIFSVFTAAFSASFIMSRIF